MVSPVPSVPFLAALQQYLETPTAAFHTPGHNRGQGIPSAVEALLGARAYHADLPDLPGLSLFEADGAVAQAQGLAAELFGAERTWFLVNGSTVGILASILATCGAGDKIILPRNVHQSVISGLVLSGAVPVFVQPEFDPRWDLAFCLSPSRVAEALIQHPDARAVLMVSPTYHGVCGDVRAIANLAHQQQIPLIVDEAHGAHFAFHPDLPETALACGADLVIQSTHKLLAALTQSAMLHAQGSRVDGRRIQQMLQMLQSSSPSSLLIASLDAARYQMADQGRALMQQTLETTHWGRTQLQNAGFSLLDASLATTAGCIGHDPTRIVVDLATLGIDGFTADAALTQAGVMAELPTLRQLAFIISLGNTRTEVETLVQGLIELAKAQLPQNLPLDYLLDFHRLIAPLALPACSPQQAFFAAQTQIPIEQSIGRTSTETLCPYPPGIPLVLPGEQITAESIDCLQQIKARGGLILGCTDPTLQQISVVESA